MDGATLWLAWMICLFSAEIPFVESVPSLDRRLGGQVPNFEARTALPYSYTYLEGAELSSLIHHVRKSWTKEFWTAGFILIIGEIRCFARVEPSANPRIVVFVRTSRLFAKPEDTETSLDCQAHGVRHWSFYDFGLLANTSGHGPSTPSSLYSRCL